MGNILTMRGKIKGLADFFLIALFTLLFLTTFSPPGQTEGLNRPDSDGKVPVKEVCDMGLNPNGNHWFGVHKEWTIRDSSGKYLRTEYVILINRCYLDSQGAGPTDRAVWIAHEKAHALGFQHYQGTPQTNAAYYPRGGLCHC